MGNIRTYNSAGYRKPTSLEQQQIVRYMSDQQKKRGTITMLTICWIMIAAGIVFVLLYPILFNYRDVSETIFICFTVIAYSAIIILLPIRLMTKERRLFSQLKNGQFEVLDCYIEKVVGIKEGSLAIVNVRDWMGGTMELLELDVPTANKFQNGENPKLLLLVFNGKPFLLSEYKLDMQL